MTLEDTYRKTLPGILHWFRRHYGGDPDDLASVADELFWRAWNSYDPARGASRETWVNFKVRKGLLDFRKRQAKHHRRRVSLPTEALPGRAPPPDFDFPALLSRLSADGQAVVGLAIHPPPDVRIATRGKPSPGALRQALRHFLLDLGWTTAEIAQTFREIYEVLS